MSRTKWLQETKQMRFEEAYGAWSEKRLTQEEAAQLLGVRGRLLPTVYRFLDQPTPAPAPRIRYPGLLEQSFGLDPLQCILCQAPLRLVRLVSGLSTQQLYPYHQPLALAKPIP